MLAEADNANQIQRYYIYGHGLIGFIDAVTNQLYTYHFDGTGHTVAITDPSQNTINTYAYDPYGKLMAESETVPQPFKYVGQLGVFAEDNGLYYMRARYYDAEIGRFISEDPIGFQGGLNLYAYVGGNPVTLVDPSGEVGILGAVVGGVIGGIGNATGAYYGGGSGSDIVSAFGVGALTGAVFGATGGAGGTSEVGVRSLIYDFNKKRPTLKLRDISFLNILS